MVRSLAKEIGNAGFGLRLFDHPMDIHQSMILYQEIDLPQGRSRASIRQEIAHYVIPSLHEMVEILPSGGRPPDMSEVAHWWGLAAFEGLTINQIAADHFKRMKYDEEVVEVTFLENMIRTALARIGVYPSN